MKTTLINQNLTFKPKFVTCWVKKPLSKKLIYLDQISLSCALQKHWPSGVNTPVLSCWFSLNASTL